MNAPSTTSPSRPRPEGVNGPYVYLPPLWRRRPVVLLLVGSLVVILVLERGLGVWRIQDDWSDYHNRTFEVINIVDGHTFDIDVGGQPESALRVRLWGVEAPLAGDPADPKDRGHAAAAFANRRLLGRDVRLVLSQERTRDHHGRLLAYVYLQPNDVMFNELLLEHGFAQADSRFEHPLKRRFTAIEKRAERNRAGLWAHIAAE